MAAAFRASTETARTSGAEPLHAKTSASCACRERQALFGDAHGGAPESQWPSKTLPARRMGKALACGRCDGCVYAIARSPSSRSSLHAGTSDGLSTADQSGIRNMDLGKTLE